MLFVSILAAYLIGSLSSSTIIGKWVAKTDIREHGSGNAGATNALRVLGWKLALLVLVLDIFKGMLAIFIAWGLGHGNVWFAYLSGLAVIIGHNWPVFFGFRGGKGVATTIGVLCLLMFVPAVLAGVIAIAIVIVTRLVSLGALIFVICTPIFLAILEHRAGAVVFAVCVAALSVYRHRKNISRLLRGQESRIFSRKL
jgi:acyl phosphate:glycerol-3-phosphate acyltransferase